MTWSFLRSKEGGLCVLPVLIGAKIRSIILRKVQACALLIAVVAEVFGSKCRTESVDICDVAWTFPWFIESWFEELWLTLEFVKVLSESLHWDAFWFLLCWRWFKLDVVLGTLILKSAGVGLESSGPGGLEWEVVEARDKESLNTVSTVVLTGCFLDDETEGMAFVDISCCCCKERLRSSSSCNRFFKLSFST